MKFLAFKILKLLNMLCRDYERVMAHVPSEIREEDRIRITRKILRARQRLYQILAHAPPSRLFQIKLFPFDLIFIE